MPNWLVTVIRPEGGDAYHPQSAHLRSYHQELHLKEGLLCRTMQFRDQQNRETTQMQRRFVHMGHMHLAALETTIIARNWSGRIQVTSSLDGSVINAGVQRYRQLNSRHLEPIRSEAADGETICLLVETSQSRQQVAEAARTRVFSAGQQVEVERTLVQQPGSIGQEFFIDVTANEPVTIEKIVSLFTSRDFSISEPALEAVEALGQAGSFAELLHSHVLQWDHLWDRCDIRLEHSPVTAALPLQAAASLPAGGSGGRLQGRPLSLAERQQRPRRNPASPPQSAIKPMAAGQHPSAAPC